LQQQQQQQQQLHCHTVLQALALVKEDVDESRMDDLSYVYSGYAPVSARIAHQVVQCFQLFM
jgi:hypothetical protein